MTFAAAPQGNQGLQDGWAVDDDGKTSGGLHLLVDGEFAYMRSAGAGWARINFRLGNCFIDWTTPIPQSRIDAGTCHTSTLNRTAADQYVDVVRAARAQGLKVLGLISNESWHAADPSEWVVNNAEHNPSGNGDNAYIHHVASTAGLLAGRFTGAQAVEEWEVWNEPNAWANSPTPGVYTGGSFIYPSNFAQMLKQSRDAIKRANPAALVLAGGVFGHDAATAATTLSVKPNGAQVVTPKGGTYVKSPTARAQTAASGCTNVSVVPSGADYLCETYTMGRWKAGWGRSGPFDHVGQHLYIDQGSTTSAGKINQFLSEVRQAYVAFEGTGTTKRTEVTEIGWNTYSFPDAATAESAQSRPIPTCGAPRPCLRGSRAGRVPPLSKLLEYHGERLFQMNAHDRFGGR